MPLLHYEFTGDAFADGAGGDHFLMDLSEGLSAKYGKLIRQGQVFRVRSIMARIYNPNTLVQDVMMAVAGNYIFMHPTGNRKKAWKNAFKAVQANRRLVGNLADGSQPTSAYDFRVGLALDYSTDVGLWNDGVKFNAWIDNDDSPLILAGHTTQGIFNVYNGQILQDPLPVNPYAGFGTWIQKDAGAIGDELDFVQNESEYFVQGQASTAFDYAPFQVAFSQLFDSDQIDVPGFETVYHGGTTEVDRMEAPLDVMCGLIGVNVDTTTVDDSAGQTEEWGVQFVVDVERWTPIFSGRKSRRKKGRGRRK